MSKKIKAIIACVVVIALLAGAALALYFTREEDTSGEEKYSEAQENTITIYKQHPNDVQRVKIKNAFDEYTIEQVHENKWRVPELQDFENIDYKYLETMSRVASFVSSLVVEEDCDDLSRYGFDNPLLSFEVEFEDGTKNGITIGAESSDKRMFYAIETGKRTVYGVLKGQFEVLGYTRYYYINDVLIPGIEGDQQTDIPLVTRMKVERPDLEKPIILDSLSKEELSTGIQQSILKMTSPVTSLISETPAQTYVYGNFGITGGEIVCAKPTEEQAKEYGFDNPTSVFEVDYDGAYEIRVVTGKGIECEHDEDEDLTGHKHKIVSYYAMNNTMDQVFKVKASDLKWMDMQPKDIISSLVFIPSIKEVSEINATIGGKEYNVELFLGEDKTDVSSMTSKVNGKDIPFTSTQKLMQLIQYTAVQDLNTREIDFAPSASIEYVYRNGKKDKIEVYMFDDRTTVISFNGNKAFVGRSTYLDKLESEIINYVEGKDVDINW